MFARRLLCWALLLLVGSSHAQERPAPSPPASVRPGINENFLKADLDVEEWIGKFEVESREVFAARQAIVQSLNLRPGMRVADVGAGTGLFSRLFAEAVGDDGWVFAVDIAPRFIEHIQQRSQQERIRNLTAVLSPEDYVSLPPQSVDLVFICDTYHHFEYPASTLASLRRALKPEGELILIDFERIPGKSSDFVLGHVRAGREVFRGEIEAAGFRYEDEIQLDALQENYVLRFTSPAP